MLRALCYVNIVGHQKIIKSLGRSIEKNSISQAYIFSGPGNLGKFSIACDFAKKIIGGDFLRINPDLMIVSPQAQEKNGKTKKNEIKIEAIRDLKNQLSMTAQSGKYKVAIIDEADRLNKASQNALLKTLEEPFPNTVLILIVQDPEKLLPTIKSRCQVKRFTLVSEREIEKIIPPGSKEREKIIFWSLGRPGLAKKLAENKEELKKREDEFAQFEGYFTKNITEKFLLAEYLSKDTENLIKKMNLWLIILRNQLFHEKSKISSKKIINLIDKVGLAINILKDTNSNARLVLENLFLEF